MNFDCRLKGGKHEELEDLLEMWVAELQQQSVQDPASASLIAGCGLTDMAITEQAKVFGEKLGIVHFQYSSGWLHRFKRRRGLIQIKPKPVKPTPPPPPPPPLSSPHICTLDMTSTAAVFCSEAFSALSCRQDAEMASYAALVSGERSKDVIDEFFRKTEEEQVSPDEALQAIRKLRNFFKQRTESSNIAGKLLAELELQLINDSS
jgi:hypothetical protein